MKLPNSFFIITTFIFFSLSTFLSAQDEPPVKWGEIPRSDLEMKTFPQDTNASALILCDFGESHFNDQLNILFSKHLRVKILTTKGYEWGTHSVVLYTAKHTERISDIEGVTYWLDEKGNMASQELGRKDIFEEEVDGNHTRYRFTLPSMKPGCIIEIRYKIESESLWGMQDWVFQHSEPVRWSEYRIRVPKCIAYATVTHGFEQYAINDREEVTQFFSGEALRYLGGKNIYECYQTRWAVQDLPAIREEPFITTTEDYLQRVDVQLSGYAFPGGGKQQVMNNWESLIKELMENKYFYEKIDDTRLVTKTAEEITKNLTSPEEKVKAVYDWISKSIVCTGGNRFYADADVNDVLEVKKGNNAEITFLLLSMLKSIGINGDPVIVSTRSNGRTQEFYPILSQFNYVLARVSLGGKYYFLDATDAQRTMELLPTKVLNVRGLVIKSGATEWVTLNTDKRYIDNSITSITLNPDGSFKGTMDEQYSEYAALRVRQTLHDKKDIDVAKELLETEKSGITIDSLSISGKDSVNIPLRIKAEISSSSYALNNADVIYINPHILNRFRENPLKAKDRKYPIDFSYRSSYKTFISIVIPDSFEVKEGLKTTSFTSAAGSVAYSRQVQVENNHINILCKYDVKDIEIKPLYYHALKEFFSKIIASNSEQLVLARIQKPIEQVQMAVPAPSQASSSETVKAKAETKSAKGKRKK